LDDLSSLLDADDEALDIVIYSRSFDQGETLSDVDERVEESFTGNVIPIERIPYNNYWLIGVDENLITSGTGTEFIEGYREQINRRVAESIYALSEMEQSVENWSSRAKGTAPLGSVGHAQLQVPHEQVREFCKMKDERKEKKTLVTETIPEQLEDLRSEKDNLEEIKQDPTTVNEHLDDVSDWQQNFRGRFESQLGAGNALVRNSTAEDVERVLDAIEAEASPDEPEEENEEASDEPEDIDDIRADQRPELLLLATEILEEMLQTPNAAPAIEDHWEEIVSSQWRTYDMADRTKFGGSATSTLEGKVEALKTFYDEKIDEFQEEFENVDLGTTGQIQEFFPPWHPLTESDREAAEQKLDKLRESRDDLLEADGRYQRVQGMKEAVRTRHNRAKKLLDDKVSSVNSLITARESEKEEAKNRIEALDRSIEQEKDELASEGTGKRLGIFPLRRDMLDDEGLTLQRVDDELNSLDDYVTQGFIDERKVRNGINQWLSNATSWEEPVFDMNYSETDRGEEKNPRQEMWLLYHEDNEQYAVEGVDTMIGGTTRRSGSDNMIDYINDPYSISFVSFHDRG
jgi:hypothetical protein